MKFKSLLTLCLAGASITAVAQGYKDGIEYYKADQFKNAKELLIRNINNADTDKAASYYYLGCIAMKEGNNAEALELFNKGIESNANYAYNYVGLGAIDLANNLPKAVPVLPRGIVPKPWFLWKNPQILRFLPKY